MRSHFGSPAGPVLVLDTSDLVGTFALGTWMLEGRILALRCLMRRVISGLLAPVAVLRAASNAAMASLSSPLASRAMPRRKWDFSQSGRSLTHTSASASACLICWGTGTSGTSAERALFCLTLGSVGRG